MQTATGQSNAVPAFVVIIPMYNEEAGAEACVRQVISVLAALPERTALITVNDGSADRTGEILDTLASRHAKLIVVAHPQNRGYGAALQTGSAKAAAEGFAYALFMDSDLTNDPGDILRFREKMREGYDVIKATRYSHGGSIQGVPFYRVAISQLGNLVASLLFRLPVRDCTNGFRAVRTELLLKMRLRENHFPIIMEELYCCRHLTRSFANVPVVLTNRSNVHRATSFTYRPSVFWAYLKYPLKSFLGIRPAQLA